MNRVQWIYDKKTEENQKIGGSLWIDNNEFHKKTK